MRSQCVVSVVNNEFIFNVVSKISIVSVGSDENIFQVVSKISVVSVVNDKTIFHLVLNVSVVARNQWWKYFSHNLEEQRSQRSQW